MKNIDKLINQFLLFRKFATRKLKYASSAMARPRPAKQVNSMRALSNARFGERGNVLRVAHMCK